MEEGETGAAPPQLRTWARVLAVLPPLVAAVSGVATIALYARGGSRMRLPSMHALEDILDRGGAVPLVVLAAVASISLVYVAVRAPARPLPPVVPFALALAPWALGSILALVEVFDAGPFDGDPGERAMNLARAMDRLLSTRWMGAALSQSLLGAVAASYAWAACAPVAERRAGPRFGAGCGTTIALALGLGAVVALGSVMRWGRGEIEPVYPIASSAIISLGWLLCVGGAASADGQPRIATLLETAALALGVSLWLAIPLVTGPQGSLVLHAVANADESIVELMLGRGTEEVVTAGLAAAVLAAILSGVTAGFAAWVVRRSPPPAPLVRRLGAPTATWAAVVALHLVATVVARLAMADEAGVAARLILP